MENQLCPKAPIRGPACLSYYTFVTNLAHAVADMANPVLVEVARGGRVESLHRGAAAVVDGDGAIVFSLGDVSVPIYPRSAVKPLQALALIESGAADSLELEHEELALACASHGGEPDHIAGVARMLSRAGLDQAALQCGAHWPIHQPSSQALARAGGTPSALHNNCSGKHAGFLCASCAMGVDHRGYTAPGHPVQRAIKAAIEDLSGAAIGEDRGAIDGCSVPTWAQPLADLARAFARFGSGHGLLPKRAAAALRLRTACATKPWFVAGTGRLCTDLMTHFGERVLVKTGAEGVFCTALPEQGLGIAIKCDDGAGRAAEVVVAALISRFASLDDADHELLRRLMYPTVRNWNGIAVGLLRPSVALTAARSST
jgi:L-asparaginase II